MILVTYENGLTDHFNTIEDAAQHSAVNPRWPVRMVETLQDVTELFLTARDDYKQALSIV